MQAKVGIEEIGQGKEALIVTELPFMVKKGGDLIRGEAIGAVGGAFAAGKVAGRAEVAALRVVDDAVLEAVPGVALLVDSGSEEVPSVDISAAAHLHHRIGCIFVGR